MLPPNHFHHKVNVQCIGMDGHYLVCLLLGICTIYPHAPVYALPNDYHRSRHHQYHLLLESIKRNERLIILKRKRQILVTIISLLDTLDIVTSVVRS